MVFCLYGMSEDCFYFNVWVLVVLVVVKCLVLVYFYGGGFVVGDGLELCYDGVSMVLKGLVMVIVNYCLGVFGFFVVLVFLVELL